MAEKIKIDKVAIFRTGSHTASNGTKRRFTQRDLDSMVKNFNAGQYKPAVVIGHPKLEDPRYGDVVSLKREGALLFADMEVAPEFHNILTKGLYTNRSIRAVPFGDGYKLRHVGVLGAEPPAIEGLPPMQFADAEEGITIDFSDYRMSTIGSILQRLRDFYIEKFGVEATDNIIRQYEIDDLKRQIEDTPEMAMPSFSETTIRGGVDVAKTVDELTALLETAQKQIADFSAKETQRDTDFAATQEENKRLKSETTRLEFSTFCEGLTREGKLPPAYVKKVLDFREILSGVETFDFSEAEGDSKIAAKPVEEFQNFLSGLGTVIDFSEVATKGKAVTISAEDAIVAGIASASPKDGGK